MRKILVAIFLLLGAGFAHAANNPANIPAVNTIAAMQALGAASGSYPTIQVLGYNSANDGGGGIFTWSSASTATVDSCTIFSATGVGTGRWIRNLGSQNISVEMCGAYRDGTNGTATRTAFQKAFDYIATTTRPSGIIEAKGPTYLFDTTGVTKASSLFCPKLQGAGINATVISFSPASSAAAFEFIGGSGSLCDGGVTGITFNGNSNAIPVKLSGQGGATIDIGMTENVNTGVLLCNCSSGQFTEQNNITVHAPDIATTQQAVHFQVSGGNASFAGNILTLNVSMDSGTRTLSLIDIGSGSYWYNGVLNANIHNFGSGGVFLIKNSSAQPALISSGTMQFESTAGEWVGLADNTGANVYYGGTVYAIGGDNGLCVGGIRYGSAVVLAKTHYVGPSGVQIAGDAQQYCLTQTFDGASGVTLNAQSLNDNGQIYRLNVFNPLNSYNASITFKVATNTSGGGSCSVGATVTSLTIDTNGWGAPTIGCTNFQPTLTNASWTAGGWIVNYDVATQ